MSVGSPIAESRIRPDEWSTYLADTDGPQLIVAGPGAGKSEFLVQRAAHLIDERGVPAHAVLVLTFSRRSAADLRARIAERAEGARAGVAASTFHSFAYRLCEVHAPSVLDWTDMPSILTGPEQVALVAELLAAESPGDWPLPFRDMLSTRTLAAEVTDFILRARERLIGQPDLTARAGERADWRALPQFLITYDRALRERNRIDYGTLQAAAVSLFDDPAVHAAVRDQYAYCLVDEFQDTTVAQAQLLRSVTGGHGNITAAADPYQSIYSFRGAELGNVAAFPDTFRAPDGAPGRRSVLATSFRVPAEILRAAERVTSSGELPGAAGPVDPAPHAGRVDLHVFDQQSEEADWIAGEIQRLHIEGSTPYDRIAVVVRTKRRLLAELSRALERRSVPHDRPDARLSEHPATQMILDITRVAVAGDDIARTRPLRRLLLGPLFDLGIGAQRNLERARATSDEGWADILAREVDSRLADLISDPSWAELPAIDGFWHVWSSLDQFHHFAHAPEAREYRAAWTSLAQSLARLDERAPGTTLASYIHLVESDDFEASPLLSFRDPGERRVTLTTLHQAKGLEFDVVFIADAVEGVLPDMRERQSLLQTEQLGSTDTEAAPLRRLQEEMRLVYTAMTRARHRVVVTATTAGIDESHQRPSRFLAAIAGDELSIDRPRHAPDRPVTPSEAEAWLRTLVTDPAAPPADRLAAITVLADRSHPAMRSPREFSMVLARGVDHGLVGEDPLLSPSQADSYAGCPRRYALERRLRIGDPPSRYMDFGNLIHLVLELCEQTARDEGRRSRLDEALQHLEAHFDSYDFGDGSYRVSWRRRAETLLEQLYEGWPHPDAVPTLLEHELSLDIEGHRWFGKADRIERNPDDTLRIVDYKTSKSPPTKKEAERSLQLGFYLLAASMDDTVGALGLPTAAEYWHPLATSPTRRVTAFDLSTLETVRDQLVEIADGITSEDWTPTPSAACSRCAVQIVCPAWPEGQEAYVR